LSSSLEPSDANVGGDAMMVEKRHIHLVRVRASTVYVFVLYDYRRLDR